MNIKRVLATGMAALMAGSTLAIGGLGQTNATAPAAPAAALTWTVADSADSWLSYAPTDASGGAVTLAGAAETEVLALASGLDLTKTTFGDAVAKLRNPTTGAVLPATSGGTPTVATGGTTKQVNFGGGTSGGTQLTTGVNAFPSGSWTNSIVPQLNSGKFSWTGTDYDWKELFSATGVRMRNDVGTDNINGTSTLEVEQSDVLIAYQFDKAINVTTKNGKGNQETTSFETTDPIEITFLGKKFQIIGVANNKLIVMNGVIGKSITDTQGVDFTNSAGKKYTVFAVQGSDNTWAKVVIKDASGAQVDTATINKGSSNDFNALDISVEVTGVRATQDNKVSGVDLVVGPKGKTKKTIDTSADVTSTGTSNDALYDGFPDWGLQTSGGTNDFVNGNIPAGAQLQLVYKPSSTKYVKAGSELKGPNNMRLANQGFNTNTFAKITLETLDGVSIQNNTAGATNSFGNLRGVQIGSDVAGTVGSAKGLYYQKMAVLFNATSGPYDGDGGGDADYPVWVAYWDGSNWKGNGTPLVLGTGAGNNNLNSQGVDSVFVLMNGTTNGVTQNRTTGFNYTFTLNYGGGAERSWYVNTSVGSISNNSIGQLQGALDNPTTPLRMILGRAAATGDTTARYGLNISWQNKSSWGFASNQAPQFRLGPTAAKAEDADVFMSTEAASEVTGQAVGTKSQTLVDNSGLQVENPASTTASDKVVILLPNKELQANLFVGASAATGTPMYATTADALTQVKAGTLTKNLILVGGPCANDVVEYLAGTVATDTLPTCKEWVGGATPKLTKGLVGVWAVGTKKALVIAGTGKADTDTFANDFKLKGVTNVAAV